MAASLRSLYSKTQGQFPPNGEKGIMEQATLLCPESVLKEWGRSLSKRVRKKIWAVVWRVTPDTWLPVLQGLLRLAYR